MFWIDTFGDGFAVWYSGEIVELCKTRKQAEDLIAELRGNDEE